MAVYELYFSPTGGTKKVTDILTDTWENERNLMDLSTAEPEGYTFQQDDLCFVGIPVFEGRVPKLVVSRLKTLVFNGAQAVAVAVYGRRAVDDALLELTDVLTETGFRCGAAIEAVAEHSILHIYAQNRPDAQDTVDLHQYAGKIQTLYEAGKLADCVLVPGNRPYIEMGGIKIHPEGNENCVQCGICAGVCPTGAIAAPDSSRTDGSKCITCMRCVSVCPTHARDFNPALVKTTQEKMAPHFAGERHNKLYISEK